ncbi:MAG: hypothetical protein OES12_00795 [Anaerolineae bacterium]|nr:hypothetical protein [Anaerolineae bacterium]
MRSLRNLSKKPISFSPSALLITCVILSGLIYLTIYTVPFPLSRFFDTIPPVDYTKLTQYSPKGFWLYVVGIIALFSLYIWAIRISMPGRSHDNEPILLPLSPNRVETGGTRAGPASTDPEPRSDRAGGQQPGNIRRPVSSKQVGRDTSAIAGRAVIWASAVLALILIFAYPLTAIDLFIYAIRTRGWGLYNLQPLSTPPEALPRSDPWLGLAGEWIDAASPYGPLWEGLSLGAFYLSGGDLLPHLFALKIIGGLAYLGCTWLIFDILRQTQPDWAIAGAIAFAWNPLVLFESVLNAHNDIVMALFLLAAIWVFVQMDQRRSGVNASLLALLFCVLVTMSILVKFVTIIIVPFFLLPVAMQQPTWSRRIGTLALYGSIVLALVFLSMALFWPGLENWALLETGRQAGRSLLALLVLSLRDVVGTNTAFDVSRTLIMTIFAGIYLYFLWQTFTKVRPNSQTPSFVPLACSAAFFVLFWYVLLAGPVFHAWYLLWFLPLAVLLLPKTTPLIIAVVFSLTALLIIPYFETIRVWYPALLRNHLAGHLIGVPLLILPPLLVLLWSIRPGNSSEV